MLSRALDCEVVAYHAGMRPEQRGTAQERFMTGRAEVIVATNAFGMGIDKADVRTVCHASVPSSLEAYYQEAGRAGRDGRPARCLLFAEQRDKGLHVFFIQRARVTPEAFERVGERLTWAGCDGRYDLAVSELAGVVGDRAPGDDDSVRAVIGHLARAGVLAPAPAPPDRAVGQITGGWDRRARRGAWPRRARPSACAGASTGRCGGTSRATAAAGVALLDHFGDRRRARRRTASRAATCATPGRSVPAPAGRCARAGASRAAGRAGRSRRRRSSTSSSPRARRSDARARWRSSAAAAPRWSPSTPIDALAGYGTFAHLRSDEVLERVDELLRAGTLRSTGGRFPKLAAA